MSDDDPPHQLSAEELVVVKFAAHRQLARWARKRELSPRQRAKRTSLVGAMRTLDDHAFAQGCELRAPREQ